MMKRMLQVAITWLVICGTGILVIPHFFSNPYFYASDVVITSVLLSLAILSAIAYVPLFAWIQPILAKWNPLGSKAMVGAILGAIFCITLTAILMYISLEGPGFKGNGASSNFLDYLPPFLYLVPIYAVVALLTPMKLLIKK
jgi:Cu/Ag efflux pump CusA